MRTEHALHVDDARDCAAVGDDAVDLVVTSPPYPLVDMWDDAFAALDPQIGEALDDGDGWAAFERMHDVLDAVWDEVARVLAPGGIACVNVGDATRTLDGQFRCYPNHARVGDALRERGLDPLPDVLWRKPANSAAKFMGSGMRPTNAYVTLEHEYVLVFRNGGTRRFDPAEPRDESAYFWEERNTWFSDVWTDVNGTLQGLADVADDAARDRSGAFPFELPYRLVCMYSVYGDTVLDPFAGTATTAQAAAVAGRNSVAYERDPGFAAAFGDRLERVPELAESVVDERLARHRAFAAERATDGDPLGYEATHYDFPVMTKGERDVRFYDVERVAAVADQGTDGGEGADDAYVATHVAR
jgi:DNA modification methylase